MGTVLMPAEENRVFEAIGGLREALGALSKKIDDIDDRTVKEQRKVHDIVVATSEAVRNLTRIVDEMKPLTDDYREKRAEARGAARLAGWLYTAAGVVGGGVVLIAGKVFEWLSQRPHIPVIAIVVAITMAARAAWGHEWYPAWCCSGGDCGPLAASRVSLAAGGYLVDGKFMVPMSEVRRSMDGRFHGCFPTADSLKCFFAPPPGS